MYKFVNLTDLQKVVKDNGFEHFNSSQTIYDSYRWFEEDNEELFCNSLISIEVYDISPDTIEYSCELINEDGIDQFIYEYGTNTDKLSVGSSDFSHPSEAAEDKELYEKIYNDKLIQELESYSY